MIERIRSLLSGPQSGDDSVWGQLICYLADLRAHCPSLLEERAKEALPLGSRWPPLFVHWALEAMPLVIAAASVDSVTPQSSGLSY